MEKARSPRPVPALTRVLALALFLTGTNYCLVNLIPGAKGCGMATEVAGAPAKRTNSCSACPSSHAASSASTASTSTASSKSKPPASRTGLPCCESYAPVTTPDVSGSAAKAQAVTVMAVMPAPAAKPAPKTATTVVKPAEKKPPQRITSAPPPGRAPPIL